MTSSSPKTLEEIVKALWAGEIDEYARGHEGLERNAIAASIPTVAAITLPEEYAALALTARMDLELEKLIAASLIRNSKGNEILFGPNKSLSTFSAKIDAAYSFGLITARMFDALTYSRQIRNAYAHTDNPDSARLDPKYIKASTKLAALDPEYSDECEERLCELIELAQSISVSVAPLTRAKALMMEICPSLATAALTSRVHGPGNGHRLPAAFGWADRLALSASLEEPDEDPPN